MTLLLGSGVPTSFTMQLDEFRRGGIDVFGDGRIPAGTFGVVVESDAPIVAALSHYRTPLGQGNDAPSGRGFGMLGVPGDARTTGVIPGFDPTSDTRTIVLLNAGDQAALVTVSFDYESDGIATLTHQVQVPASGRATVDLDTIGLVDAQRASAAFVSNRAVTAYLSEYAAGSRDDALGTAGATRVATGWLFADAFINRALAGTTYTEYLVLFNPDQAQTTITVDYLFTDGTVVTRDVQLGAREALTIELHADTALLDHMAPTFGRSFFSVRAVSDTAFAASMTHWDLFQNGGFSMLGTPIAFVEPLVLT